MYLNKEQMMMIYSLLKYGQMVTKSSDFLSRETLEVLNREQLQRDLLRHIKDAEEE